MKFTLIQLNVRSVCDLSAARRANIVSPALIHGAPVAPLQSTVSERRIYFLKPGENTGFLH